ncbi:hypothetical protein AB6A40_002505 [Gnathostoma spinigerum]|uniref:Aldehyde dehydrogenase domain-containing protein n=1 Tax=Gnathostoma spinigerum TaxID=75299 RepID=A0ABD6E9C3_9BILA
MSVHQIIEKQRTFFRDGHTRSLEFRKNQLKQLKKMMNDEKDYFTNAVYKDLRREQRVTFFMEIAMTVTEIDDTLAHLNEWAAPEVVSRTAATLLDTPMIVKDPLGVVLIIAPWNYPVCLVTLPLVSALAAGNTVIIKPSEVSVATSSALAKFIPKYFKPEVVSVVEGGVPETTELLKERFDRILYTGSTSVGKVVMTAAAKHLTPVTLELGGKSPTVVLEDADIATSARRIAWGKWINSGQTCIAPDYIITSSRVKPLLVDAIRKTVDEFYGKDIKTCNDYARMINERQFE